MMCRPTARFPCIVAAARGLSNTTRVNTELARTVPSYSSSPTHHIRLLAFVTIRSHSPHLSFIIHHNQSLPYIAYHYVVPLRRRQSSERPRQTASQINSSSRDIRQYFRNMSTKTSTPRYTTLPLQHTLRRKHQVLTRTGPCPPKLHRLSRSKHLSSALPLTRAGSEDGEVIELVKSTPAKFNDIRSCLEMQLSVKITEEDWEDLLKGDV
ncbi:hypothetical protein PSPO01_07908 [Paraphaeosphaeria sporulosa]